jgi:hypothetical protein
MAKYDVIYSCGHSGEVQLFGPHKERDRKIEWYERQAKCPECYKVAKREEESKQPITANVSLNIQYSHDHIPMIQIVLAGGTLNRKDEIKALGYRWEDVCEGVMGMLSMSQPRKGWVKRMDYAKDTTEIKLEIDKLKGIVDKVDNHIGPLDVAYLQKSVQDQDAKQSKIAEQQTKIDALPKPERPTCHPRAQHPDGHWNGKYYGKPGYWNYYVESVNYKLTNDEYALCMEYRKKIEEYNTAVETLKKEIV